MMKPSSVPNTVAVKRILLSSMEMQQQKLQQRCEGRRLFHNGDQCCGTGVRGVLCKYSDSNNIQPCLPQHYFPISSKRLDLLTNKVIKRRTVYTASSTFPSSSSSSAAGATTSSQQSLQQQSKTIPFSSLAVEDDDELNHSEEEEEEEEVNNDDHNSSHKKLNQQNDNIRKMQNKGQPCPYCHNDLSVTESYDTAPLPEPLKEPEYSVRRRLLVASTAPTADDSIDDHDNTSSNYWMVPLNSSHGKQLLIESLSNNTASSYIALTEHFSNQDDPAFCGITTLMVVLNALQIDPTVVRWKGGWRYFANENVLLALHPCIDAKRIHSTGITMEQFHRLATCQGLHSIPKRPIAEQQSLQYNNENNKNYINSDSGAIKNNCTIEEFRNDIIHALSEEEDRSTKDHDTIVVVSFSRAALKQTGDGHFSPIAAYHAETDSCLILDVARFKYQPYWVGIKALYDAVKPIDPDTKLPRGWFLLQNRYQKQQQTASSSPSAARSRKPTTNPATVNNMKSTRPGNMNMLAGNNHQNQGQQQQQQKLLEDGNGQHQNQQIIKKPVISSWNSIITSEDRLPARLVPLAGQGNPCPIHIIKGQYCQNNITNHQTKTVNGGDLKKESNERDYHHAKQE